MCMSQLCVESITCSTNRLLRGARYVCVCICIRGVWQINLEPRFEKMGLLGPQDNGLLNEPNHVPCKPS